MQVLDQPNAFVNNSGTMKFMASQDRGYDVGLQELPPPGNTTPQVFKYSTVACILWPDQR